MVNKDEHPTELKSPLQCEAFKRIVKDMYSIHLDKNLDYSPMNVSATGEVGLTTRVWDKVARLVNLMGFDISTGKYSAPKEPKNESIEDNLRDLANYAIIWQIYREGNWGK